MRRGAGKSRAMARAQLLAAAVAVLVACCSGRSTAPSPYFFYPPQRGYVQQVQVPGPQRLPPGVTQTVYVVLEDAEEHRGLLAALPSLLEMLSAGEARAGAGAGSGSSSAFPTAKTPVFVDDSEPPQFDKNAWHQGEGGAYDDGNYKQQDTAAPAPVPGEVQPTGHDSTQLEDAKEPSDPPLDYPIDVRSGFARRRETTLS